MNNKSILLFVSDASLISISEMEFVEHRWNNYDKFVIFALKENEIDMNYTVFKNLWLYFFDRKGLNTSKLIFCMGSGICFNTPKSDYLNGLLNYARSLGYQDYNIHISVPIGTDIIDIRDKIDYQTDSLRKLHIEYDIRQLEPDFGIISRCFKAAENTNLCKSYLFPNDEEKKRKGQFFGTEKQFFGVSQETFENKILEIFNETLKSRDVYIYITRDCIPNKETMEQIKNILLKPTTNNKKSKYIYLSICSNEKPTSKTFMNVKLLWETYFTILSKTIGYEIKSFYYIFLPLMDQTWNSIIKTIDDESTVTIIYTNDTIKYIDNISMMAEQQTRYVENIPIESGSINKCLQLNCPNPFPEEFDESQRRAFRTLFNMRPTQYIMNYNTKPSLQYYK